MDHAKLAGMANDCLCHCWIKACSQHAGCPCAYERKWIWTTGTGSASTIHRRRCFITNDADGRTSPRSREFQWIRGTKAEDTFVVSPTFTLEKGYDALGGEAAAR